MDRGGLPKDDNLSSNHEARAKIKHDQLIAMGGRPTRPVRLQPSWNVIDRHGNIYLYGSQGELKGTLSDDGNPMKRHWRSEEAYFKKEICHWRDFRRYQRKTQDLDRLGTGLQLDHANAEFERILKRLSDWEEFEVFWGGKNVDALIFEDACRCYFSNEMKSEALGEESSPSSKEHEKIRIGLLQFDRSQAEVSFTKSWMEWTKGEWPKLVAESIDAISKTPELHLVLEARFKKQTYATFSAIQILGGQPGHAVSPPDDSMDNFHRILHWSSETAIYKEELSDWKKFLQWRRRRLGDSSTMDRQRDQCLQFRSALEFFGEFEHFRHFQYNQALNWVKCWQRILKWYEDELEMPNPDYRHYTPQNLGEHAEAARSRVIESKERLADAARQLEKSVEEHARALSDHVSFSDGETRIKGQQGSFLPTPPPSNSGCSRTSRSSSPSYSDCSLSSRSPHSSRSSFSSHSSHFSQCSHSAEPPSTDRNPRIQTSSSEKAELRSKNDARQLGAMIGIPDIKAEQQALQSLSPRPQRVKNHDDIEMTDASEDPGTVDGAENEDTDMADPGAVGGADIEDTHMTNPHDALGYDTLFSSESRSRPSTKIESKKPLISSGDGVASRKTRSASRPDHTVSGRVPKNVGKKPTKNAKTFTEQQAIILLDAASAKSSALQSPPLRRSDRLEKSLTSNGNGVASRKTSSVLESDRTVSGRIPKNIGKKPTKKPTKKAKTFTEKQAIILLDAALTTSSTLESPILRRSDRLEQSLTSDGKGVGKKPTKEAKTFTEHQDITILNTASSNAVPLESPPLRRSDRLKEKASASAITPPSHPNPVPSLQPPEQMQPKRKSVTIKSSRPSRQKMPKIQPNALEPLQDSTPKKSKIQSNTIEQSRSRRQKKLEKRARSTVRPG